jgi:hypothetical protein
MKAQESACVLTAPGRCWSALIRFRSTSTMKLLTSWLVLCIAMSGVAQAEEASAPVAASAAEPRTLKERLGDKASDEQRVDNCHVPPERRGTKVRPDTCVP